jgi:hypothetical protein
MAATGLTVHHRTTAIGATRHRVLTILLRAVIRHRAPILLLAATAAMVAADTMAAMVAVGPVAAMAVEAITAVAAEAASMAEVEAVALMVAEEAEGTREAVAITNS